MYRMALSTCRAPDPPHQMAVRETPDALIHQCMAHEGAQQYYHIQGDWTSRAITRSLLVLGDGLERR